ncbi:MAG: hypothetical protein JXR37_26865, partial [Kiritimatiellae bacterium]|nr:hypothetical protein [Kiritimatiellia bacterium]
PQGCLGKQTVVAGIERIATPQHLRRKYDVVSGVAILDSRNERLRKGKEGGRSNFELFAP